MTDDPISPEERMLEIPSDMLAPETLQAVIEEYITREGTDYGVVEMPLEQKVKAVQRQLASGRAVLLFDTIDQTCTIVSADEFQKRKRQMEEIGRI